MANGFNGFFDDPIDSFINKYKTKIYEPAVRRSQRDERNQSFDNQYDLRAEERRVSDTEGLGLPTPERLRAVGSMVDTIYGSPDPLSDEQEQTLADLTARNERLQPADFGVLGGARIAGNPYSIDTRGLLTGLSDLAEGFINKERAERRGEFTDELSELETQKTTNQEIAQNRQQALRDLLPEEFTNAYEQAQSVREDTRETKTATALEQLKQKGRIDLEELRGKNDQILQRIKNQGSGGGGPSVQLMRDYVQGRTAEQDIIWEKLQTLYDIQSDPASVLIYNSSLKSPEKRLTDQIKDLEKDYLDINQDKADMIMKMGQIPNAGSVRGEDDNKGEKTPLQTEDGTITTAGLKAYMDKWDITESEARQALSSQGFNVAGGQ